ncbi:MAG: GntR family transcriptional regulator [Alphaproteobacteria bacterium]
MASPKAAPASKRPEDAGGSAHLLYKEIIRGLYQGRYVPGQRLVETDLTHAFDISRSSVREALNRLSAAGIVELKLYHGAHVRHLTRAQANDILVLLEPMIGLAARLAAERIGTGDHARRLRASHARLTGFRSNPDSLDSIQARDEFYAALIAIGGNQELARIMPSMQVHLVRAQFRAFRPAFEDKRFDDYDLISKAVLAGDGPRAESAGRRHIQHVRKGLAALPDAAFAPDARN